MPHMPILLLLFTVASVLTTGLHLLLQARQSAHVARHQHRVPPEFEAMVSLDQHRTAARYEQARLRLGAAAALFGLGVAVAWAWFGYQALYAALALHVAPGLARSVLFLLAVSAVSAVLGLPFAIARTFGVEQRFGFNRTTPAGFARDRLKGWALSLALATPLLFGLLWLMRQPGPWWLWAWLGCLALLLLMMDVAPRWITPWFNRFTPLEGPLRDRIEALLRRCGFEAAGLFVMDASRRSGHGNAYFTGFGRSKRIVLFDTLIAAHSEAELEAVLAHELGHFELNHILLGLAQTAVLLFLGFFAVGWLCHQPWLALALIVCLRVVQTVGPAVAVGGNWISRRHEFQADDFARRMVGAAPMVSALVRLARDNASTLTTDSLYALMTYSHPPVPLRVARLQQ